MLSWFLFQCPERKCNRLLLCSLILLLDSKTAKATNSLGLQRDLMHSNIFKYSRCMKCSATSLWCIDGGRQVHWLLLLPDSKLQENYKKEGHVSQGIIRGKVLPSDEVLINLLFLRPLGSIISQRLSVVYCGLDTCLKWEVVDG